MSNILSITVSGKTYNVPRASAVKQKETITMIGGLITQATASTGTEINVDVLTGALILLSNEKLLELESKLFNGQIVLSGTTNLITINDFQDNAFSYFRLLAEVLKANLQDFFTYLDAVNEPRRLQLVTVRARNELIK